MDDHHRRRLAIIGLNLLIIRRIRNRRRVWARQWLQRREEESVYHRLLREMSLEDPASLRNWIRLDKFQYQELLRLVAPLISKKDTNMRRAVTAGERLTITLRYLATGESHASLANQFRVSHNLISAIVPEVSRAIYQVLKEKYVKMPTTSDEWHQVASEYFSQWNFPLCIGALDGKRILLHKLSNSGSDFFDYKDHYSMIMMALVDAQYRFLYVDVGAIGKTCDDGVWDACTLKQELEAKMLGLPEPENIPLTNKKCNYVVVGDDAFPLKPYLMKPFPGRDQTAEQRIFNYRLSRARRTAENAFGILSSRFQIFRTPINTSPSNVKDIAFATVALHNYLRDNSPEVYCPLDMVEREDTSNGRIERGMWRHDQHGALQGLQAVRRGHSNEAKTVRETLKDYFNNEGKVSWQDEMALLH